MMLMLVLLSVTVLPQTGDAARILGVVSTPSYSHQIVFQPLWKELSLRGHQVTTITTDPINDPSLTNLTEIDWHFSYVQWNKIFVENVFDFKNNSLLMATLKWMDQLISMADEQLGDHNVQKLLNSNQKFDLLIVEPFTYSMFGFAERFHCPIIAMLSLDGFNNLYQLMGNPTHPVVYPDIMVAYDKQMSFAQRLHSVLTTLLYNLIDMYSHRIQNQLIKKHFGENYPPVIDIMRNTSMLFVNTDLAFHKIRPLVPTVIQIGGGSHLKPPKALPQDLQKVLDNAKEGFIYFSLGSNVKSKDIPLETRVTIMETFSELPYTVLWKFEAENLPNKSDNVIISKWLPQQDVLRHRNIKLFITQGGLQSSDETIHAGVPVIGMPFFGDQEANVKQLVDKGIGLSVEYTSLAKEDFKNKILEVIQNQKYRERIVELAALARDQPMTGLERAVWWTEYVIRHKGARHLRSPLLDIPWYQYLLLDVLAVLFIGLGIPLYMLYKLIRFLYHFIKRLLKNLDKKNK